MDTVLYPAEYFQYQARHPLKLLKLFVTSIALVAMACPAIAVSFGPFGVSARRSATLISVIASTAARS